MLTNSAIQKAKPSEKQRKLGDQGGLHLMVNPTGSKVWKYDYRIDGKKGTYTIGKYPEISLKEAREYHLEAKRLVAKGINPTSLKRSNRSNTNEEQLFSFHCKKWVAKQNLAQATLKDLNQRLEKNIYPFLDAKPVTLFTTRDLRDVLLPISERGARETARRLAGILVRVFDELLILDMIDSNPAEGLKRVLPAPDPKQKTNFGHIVSHEELADLIKQIHAPSKRQDPSTTLALKLMPLVFLRPYNIRHLRWEYVDFNAKLITIPASEMKGSKELKIPMASQVIDILREAETITKGKEYVFMTNYGNGKPMSENTTTAALKRMINPKTGEPYGTGFMTSHGFRHTASTFLHEMGFNSDAIELQLAHENKDRIKAIYNKAQLMQERISMMQQWANFIYKLGGNV